jgi:hypothetical protein
MADNPLKKWAFTISSRDYVVVKHKDAEDEQFSIDPISSDQLSAFLESICDEFCYQQEYTPGNPHFQGRLRLKTKKRQRTLLNEFSYAFVKNWRSAESSESSARVMRSLFTLRPEHSTTDSEFYALKDETAVTGSRVLYPIPIPPYQGEDLYLDSFNNKFAWQSEMEQIVSEVLSGTYLDHNRAVLVLQDVEGCSGKSVFAKRLLFKNNPRTIYLPVVDTLGQLTSALSKIEQDVDLLLFDIPRSLKSEDVKKAFVLAEIVKSGIFVSSFYGQLRQRLQKPPCVIIFTNIEIFNDDIKGYIPLNRFHIYNITFKDTVSSLTRVFDFPFRKREESSPIVPIVGRHSSSMPRLNSEDGIH